MPDIVKGQIKTPLLGKATRSIMLYVQVIHKLLLGRYAATVANTLLVAKDFNLTADRIAARPQPRGNCLHSLKELGKLERLLLSVFVENCTAIDRVYIDMVLDIETARNTIISEIQDTMLRRGIAIDPSHFMLPLADVAAYTGEVFGSRRVGASKFKDSMLMLASVVREVHEPQR
ncbi:transcription by RNA polymerase III [Blastocladiella emersonii ATCC 22665]|nr:transcription by RNA polymerase III [Blastocladiella emersonii ATCC 22665]